MHINDCPKNVFPDTTSSSYSEVTSNNISVPSETRLLFVVVVTNYSDALCTGPQQHDGTSPVFLRCVIPEIQPFFPSPFSKNIATLFY